MRALLVLASLCFLACKPIVGIPVASHLPPSSQTAAVDVWPSWSPDASEIVFLRRFPSQYGPAGLYRLRLDSNHPDLILQGGFLWPGSPRYSPDGAKIAMDYNSQLLIYDLHTGVTRTPFYTDNGVRAPDWSPDGRRLVYSRVGRLAAEPPDSGGSHVFDLPTGSDTYIPGLGSNPRWAPDGDRIAFIGGIRELRVRNLESGATDTLFRVAGRLENPQWIANDNGQAGILVTEQPQGLTWLVSTAAGGGRQSMRPPLRLFDSVSRDGQHVIFLKAQQDSIAVLFYRRTKDPLGTTVRQITTWRPQ